MKIFGIIGFPLSHSFSSRFFSDKFETLKIDAQYVNFSIESINAFPEILKLHPDLEGLNVTMPYKEKIIPFLDELSLEAEKTGAVNVVKIIRKGYKNILKGYNTDVYGFMNSLKPLLKPFHKKALIFGTGGASKAVTYGLSLLGIHYNSVSRFLVENNLIYSSLTPEIINEHKLIINATPAGMYPDVNNFPEIPYQGFSKEHLAYDLIYNPEKTLFLKKASNYGATVKNGMEMLLLQAEEAWKIWNE